LSVTKKIGTGAASVAITVFLLGAGVAGAIPARTNMHRTESLVSHARATKIEATSGLRAKYNCTKASAVLAKIGAAETKVSAEITRAQAKAAAATAAGDATKAEVLGAVITAAQQVEAALGDVATLITTACPS